MAIYTREESEYLDDVIESEGFYVMNDYGRKQICGIVKIDENSEAFEKAKKAAIFAVDKYNEKKEINSKLKFLRLMNVNFEPTAGAMYYITLAAKDSSFGKILHYQAKVWEKINTGYKVDIFRLAPYMAYYSESDQEEKHCYIMIENLQDWMDENYLYYRCCYLFQKKVAVEVIRDEETGKSKGYGYLWFKTHSAPREFLKANEGRPILKNPTRTAILCGKNTPRPSYF